MLINHEGVPITIRASKQHHRVVPLPLGQAVEESAIIALGHINRVAAITCYSCPTVRIQHTLSELLIFSFNCPEFILRPSASIPDSFFMCVSASVTTMARQPHAAKSNEKEIPYNNIDEI